MSKLADNGIITRVGVNVGADFFQKLRPSKAEGRKGSNIGVWKLADRVKAASFLRSKHSHRELAQAEFLTS